MFSHHSKKSHTGRAGCMVPGKQGGSGPVFKVVHIIQ